MCQSGGTDAQCDAPATYAYYYMPAVDQSQVNSLTGPTDLSEAFQSYDPTNPPLAATIATTTTDNGTTIPYIIRVETGYLDRDRYSIAMLWQPGKRWSPWAPQPQWDHKLVVRMARAAAPTTPPAPRQAPSTAPRFPAAWG